MPYDRSLGLNTLLQETSTVDKDCLLPDERSAIHSGKLGDIVYSLPTCRALGVNHLVINLSLATKDPLRTFHFEPAKQLVPLLLAQSYLRKVTIVQVAGQLEDAWRSPGNVNYNLDIFRLVARHRAGGIILDLPRFARFRNEDAPAHLGEIFAAGQGITVDLSRPWLNADGDSGSSVVISVTRNWRSYPNEYWRLLTEGLVHPRFVGLEAEFAAAPVADAEFIPTFDHLQLARVLSGAALFLGTVSFPYAIAEGLKTKRFVEVCHRQLNAFPIGRNGFVLPPDVLAARRLVVNHLPPSDISHYAAVTRRLSRAPKTFFYRHPLAWKTFAREANHTFAQTLRHALQRVHRRFSTR